MIKKEEKNNQTLRITTIVCLTLLGVISIIGLFFGKAGLELFGFGLAVILSLFIVALGLAQTGDLR